MSHIIVNGKKFPSISSCISAYDRGLSLGHGLFETILTNKRSIPLLDYHWKRLITSVNFLDIKLPFNLNDLSTMINDLLHDNELIDKKGGVRLTITDGISDRGLLPIKKSPPTFILTAFSLPEVRSKSMSATIVKTQRNENSLTSRIKSISYLDNVFAKKEAVANGFDEAFLLNSKKYVAEGSVSNIFIVKNNSVYTPPIIDGALPGVVRHVILNDLKIQNIRIKEVTINVKELMDADEIFITNALMGVMPIHQIDTKKLCSDFHITHHISNAFNEKFNYL